jgi:hypothetical protein
MTMYPGDKCSQLIGWYEEVLGFTNLAATTLCDVQMLKDKKTLSKLDDNAIENICKVVCKDTGQSVAELATTRIKLLCFWIKHQDQTTSVVGRTVSLLVQTTITMINLLKMQKRDEDAWASENKEPDYISITITLDTSSAMKAFEKVKNILTHVCGMMGVPLVYVVRHQLISKNKDDDSPFGEEDNKYTSADMEMTACTPILSDKANYTQEYNTLETNGPFVPSFLTDSKKVWSFLHACFGTLSAWQHVRKFAAQKNGCRAWQTLHNHGGDKVNTMCSDILLTLKSLHYGGDHKNFNFYKY